MSYFDRMPGNRALREFTIRRDRRGRWLVSETHSPCRGAFRSCKEALRFALYEGGGDVARVHAEPSQGRRALAREH